MKKVLILTAIAAMGVAAYADIPAGYYDSLEGKSGETLKAAVKTICKPAGFSTVSYGDKTWEAFEKTDSRMINGKPAWWDMYSNVLCYVEEGHPSLNIEHSVAKSWWGKDKVDAFNDLFHLNPSDQNANNSKSNLPLGVVSNPRLINNGVSRIGDVAAGYGGGSATAFEPADEYKGDFARAYFYIFTSYDDLNWVVDTYGYMFSMVDNRCELQPWAVNMLLDWARRDPVDDKEVSRNEEIYKIQKNRNPFIDCPALMEYIWGTRKSTNFSFSDAVAPVCNRPSAPAISDAWMNGINTYYVRGWQSVTTRFFIPEGAELWASVNGGSYERYGDAVTVTGLSTHEQVAKIAAYSVRPGEYDGDGTENPFRSPITYVTLVGADPEVTDYSSAVWEAVKDNDMLEAGTRYILTDVTGRYVMSREGGAGSTKYMQSLDYLLKEDDEIRSVPYNVAVIELESVKGTRAAGQYLIHVLDASLGHRGYISTTAAKSLTLNSTQGTPASISVEDDGTATIDFGTTPGKLQFNSTQPRFLNYTTNQGKVKLYAFKEHGTQSPTGISMIESDEDNESIGVSDGDIYAPEGSVVFDLNGRRMSPRGLSSGIYLVMTPGGKRVKILVR